MRRNLKRTVFVPNRYLEGMRRWFKPSPLPSDKRPEKTVVKLPLTPLGSGSLIRRREQNENNDNSASQLLFQVRHRAVLRKRAQSVFFFFKS